MGATRILAGLAAVAGHLNLLMTMLAISGVTAVVSFLGYGMSAARRFREQLPVAVVSVIICAVSAYVLTPRWGLMGAALAILFSGLAQIVASLMVLGRAVRAERDATVQSFRVTLPRKAPEPVTLVSPSASE